MLFFTERKASKELQASGLSVCAADSGSVAAMKDGIHARGARVIRQSPPLLPISCRKALTRRAPCACERELSTRSCVPHGEWWPVRAVRALQHLSSRGYVLASRWMEFEAIASMSLLVLFSSVRKAHFFSFGKEKRVLFLSAQEKNEKKPQASGLTVCATGSGSMAAIKDGLHAREARVIRQPPPLSVTSCRRALTRRAPCACVSQQKYGSLRR